jgi:NADH-ubiquinone oxidoreductase chain 2
MLSVYLIIDWYFFKNFISVFNGLIYSSINTIIFIFFIFLLSFLIIILTSFYPVNKINGTRRSHFDVSNPSGENNKESYDSSYLSIKEIFQAERDHFKLIEYPLITQFIIIGGITLLSSNDLITIFLSIELQSYGLYILSTIYRNSESSTEAGLTYFLLGGLSSCIILLGLSFLYINSGTTNLDSIYLIHNIITSNNNLIYSFLTSTGSSIFSLNYYQYTIQFSLVILSIGFLFKISAAPFHSWSPGVYDAIPTVTTTFVAIIPKISILILLFDLVYSTWYTTFDYSWTSIFLYSSFLSLIIGSVLGLTQFKIKRLYAYSTISHVGFILLALSVHSVESTQAFFFYIIQYSLSNLNAFLILVLIGFTYVNYKKKTESNEPISSISKQYKEKLYILSPIQYIDDIKGYFYLNPILAISLSITLYSFIGVPPLVGFFAKQMILSSALDNGYIFMCLIAILTSVISAVYYLYIVKHMFFEKSNYILDIELKKIIKIQLDNFYFSLNTLFNTMSNSNENINLYKNFEEKNSAKQDMLITLTNSNIPSLKLNKVISNISPANSLTGIISILTLIMLLFIFLYYEIYFLTNIVSIFIIY